MQRKIYKFLSLFGLAILLFLSSCNREKQFIIRGELKSSKEQYIYLAEMNLTETKIVDSTRINSKGLFKFKVHITDPEFYQLLLSRDNFIILLIDPGQKISIKANAKNLSHNYTLEGSEGSVQVKTLIDHLALTRETLDSLEKIMDAHVGKPDFDVVYSRLNNQYIATIKSQRNFSIKFIIGHLHSISSIVALYQQLNDSTYVLNQNRDLQFINLVADTLNKYYPNSKPVKILCSDKVRLNNIYNSLKIFYIGSHSRKLAFPDIVLQNSDADSIRLNQLKRKCILVNFWSPSNEDCIVVMHGIRELYAEYKKKGFEVYNIALTENKEMWVKYIKTNNVPGINVIDQRAANSYYARIYNVNALPASYLIGPSHEIVGKDLLEKISKIN